MIKFHVVTIFPEMFSSYLNESIIGRAVKKKLISIKFYNPRDFIIDKKKNGYRPVDDKPYGGGPGMVMKAEPILKAVETVLRKITNYKFRIKNKKPKVLIINFIPRAEKFTTDLAKKISKKYTDVILICGRYEGIDGRVDKILKSKKISIGDYVLTGGELPAMVLIDSISRQIEGVLGNFDSREEERISSSEVYTRPEKLVYKKRTYQVPKVLLSGHHKNIESWKKEK